MRKYIEKINKSIEFVFYGIFLTTPLAMHPYTSELFEFNKMWLVYIYSLILFFLWGTKIIIERKLEIRRTPFDIFLLLFLASQFIATIFSMDHHTSFWGYYSRFNGGFLSMLCYVFLYFAFSTNVLSQDKEESLKKVGRMLFAVFLSGVLVALWGFPSHFGYDPTCLAFRGTFDVSCWTEAFQPKIRMFSTLGQPNWLAAFLMILIPIGVAYLINSAKEIKRNSLFDVPLFKTVGFFLAVLLFYLDLGWTLSQSGFIGFWVGNAVFVGLFTVLSLRKNSFSVPKLFKQRSFLIILLMQIVFLTATFLTINPIPRLQVFTLAQIMSDAKQQKSSPSQTPVTTPTPPPVSAQPALDASITGSGDIRKIVWQGAIDIWKAYPAFGTGVETYAFAYYKFRPAAHNLTSEWDYLYNKAHNEFLNYLATTGAFGFGTYILFLGSFLVFAFHYAYKNFKRKVVGNPLLPALVGSFVGIQVSNFFGFSVVNVNMLMFLIPLFYWCFTKPSHKLFLIPKGEADYVTSSPPGTGRIMVIIGLGIFCLYCILFLTNYWSADIHYGLGYNYNRINAFAEANPSLEKAVEMRGGEDLYKNELSVNLAALALIAAQQQDQNTAIQYATRAKELSDEVASKNPNNVVYWKARTRVMFSLAELSPTTLSEAVAAIERARELAPTDAKVIYNQALIYDQAGEKDQALALLDKAIELKANYKDAYYAKALFLSQKAEVVKDKPEQNTELKKEAREALDFVLKNISPNDQQVKDLLNTLQ